MYSCHITAVMPTEFCYHYTTHRRIFLKKLLPSGAEKLELKNNQLTLKGYNNIITAMLVYNSGYKYL